jgi:hypothetical protein
LRQNQADFVAVDRGLIADPEWPRKALEGGEKEIRPCISCNFCYGRLEKGLPEWRGKAGCMYGGPGGGNIKVYWSKRKRGSFSRKEKTDGYRL